MTRIGNIERVTRKIFETLRGKQRVHVEVTLRCRQQFRILEGDRVGAAVSVSGSATLRRKRASHDVIKGFIKNAPFLNKFFVSSDNLIGYCSMKDPRKYWERPLKSG